MYKNYLSFSKFAVRSFVLVLVPILMSCAGPGHYIRDSTVSLTETRRTLVKQFGEPRRMSQNGREFTSNYMDNKGRMIESAKKAKERRFAHVTILGERRPYDILVNVVLEDKLEDGTYIESGDDEALAEALAKTIRVELLKSLENRNIIDDFNAF